MRKNIKINRKLLIQKYIHNKLSMNQIAKELDCSPSTIKRNLVKYNIKIRNRKDIIHYWKCKHTKQFKKKLSKLQSGINNPSKRKEVREKIRLKKLGIKHKENCNCPFCKDKTGKNNPNYRNGRKILGNLNPNWCGGKSFEPYSIEFNNILKREIRERDEYTCQLCDCTEEEHILLYSTILLIHHIDYNKKNCKKDNLITLCKHCNSRVNFNREYWKKYFKEIINEIYNRDSYLQKN